MFNLNNVLTCGFMVFLSSSAIATDMPTVVSENTQVIKVVSEVTKVTSPDGIYNTVKTEDLIAGTKVLKRVDGTCFKETVSVENNINVKSSDPGVYVDLPVTMFKSEDVDCVL